MDGFNKRLFTCSFTGHRPSKLPWGGDESDRRCMALKSRLEDEILRAAKQSYMHFICGGAVGGDFYFAEAVIALRKIRPDFTLEIAVPHSGQAEGWSDGDRARYDAILSAADAVNVLERAYTPNCMLNRNRYMVDKSSLLIAVYNGHGGGTKFTIDYAYKNGLDVVAIRP